MKSRYTLLIAATIFFVSTTFAQSITYVAPVNMGNGDGSSWANARADLFSILQTVKNTATAATPAEVWVMQGTYTTATGALNRSSVELSFEVGANVELLGGFAGTEADKSQARPANNVTVLSGELDNNGVLTDNSYTVVLCDGCGSNAVLSGFTVTGGFANSNSNGSTDDKGRAGGGLYLDGGSGKQANLMVVDVEFSDNSSEDRGGAAYFKGNAGESSPTFLRCSFLNNKGGSQGGAIYGDASQGGVCNPSFDQVLMANNATINQALDGSGGAMYVSAKAGGSAALNFSKTRIVSNQTHGAVNPANSSANGGALYIATIDPGTSNGAATANFDNCIIAGNAAFSGGGLYLNGVAQTTFNNTTIINNQALGNGGSGGGVYINSSAVTALNHISFGNTVPNNANGGEDFRFVNGTLNISYSLLAAVDAATAFSRASTNGADVYNDGVGIIYGQDPQLVDQAGFPTPSSAASPVVNAGDPAGSTSSTDAQGSLRVQQGVVDLGAIESTFAPLPVDLISFGAKAAGSQVKLTWLTAQEIDLAGYSLERSTNGTAFKEVAYVPAMGTGNYSYNDLFVADGQVYYYRLRSIDFDGTDYESRVVVVTLSQKAGDSLLTALYPNPTTGVLTVEIPTATTSRAVYVSVFDASGRKVRMWPLTKDGTHTLDLHDLVEGQYIVRLDSGGKSQSEMLTIKR